MAMMNANIALQDFNLAVGCLSRTPHGRYPEYHTSADNLDFVKPEFIMDSLKLYLEFISLLEKNRFFQNTNPKCEPQLGKRGLYRQFGGAKDEDNFEMALLWVLNFSDGQHNLLDIAKKSDIQFRTIVNAAEALVKVDLLRDRINLFKDSDIV